MSELDVNKLVASDDVKGKSEILKCIYALEQGCVDMYKPMEELSKSFKHDASLSGAVSKVKATQQKLSLQVRSFVDALNIIKPKGDAANDINIRICRTNYNLIAVLVKTLVNDLVELKTQFIYVKCGKEFPLSAARAVAYTEVVSSPVGALVHSIEHFRVVVLEQFLDECSR